MVGRSGTHSCSDADPELADVGGRPLSPTAAQLKKLAAIRRTHPELLLLGQHEDGTIRVSVPARFRRGGLESPRTCAVSPDGSHVWS